MTFIETTPTDPTDETMAGLHAADRERLGYVANYTRLLAQRPAAYLAWKQLAAAIGGGMDTRRYELATVAAAKVIGSSYCCLAHGKILAERYLGPERTRAVVTGLENGALDEVDTEIVRFATKVTSDAASVTEQDVARLRALGLSDGDVLDVTLAVAARCFFSTVLEALGVQPDPAFRDLEPELRTALTVGRPIADG